MVDHEQEITLLTEVVKKTAGKLQELVEKDPSSLPPMTVMVLKEIHEGSVEDDGTKTFQRMYAGIAIFDPDEKEEIITEILKINPLLQAYGLIIHADTYEVSKEEAMDASPEDYEKLKKTSTRSDALVGTIVEPGGSKIVTYLRYTRNGTGVTKWEDQSETLGIQNPENSVKSNPAYHRPFVTEKDFE